MDITEALGPEAELFFKALAGEATEVHCEICGTGEWVVPLDGDLDAGFLANYRCDGCDSSEPVVPPAPTTQA